MNLQELLAQALERGASDIHIVVGQRPIFRINTELVATEYPVVTTEVAVEMVRQMIGPRRYARFLRQRDVDFSAEVPGRGCNSLFQRALRACCGYDGRHNRRRTVLFFNIRCGAYC